MKKRKVRLGEREKEFLEELKALGGIAPLYDEIAPRVFGVGDYYPKVFASKIAQRLEEKGYVKNVYKKRRKRYVVLVKDFNEDLN